ncbi:MAG: FkbM family methyltransferase [Desulfobacterales bacterium]|nr:FkbM family methyltransferase [Desulfobacterales bacterium]
MIDYLPPGRHFIFNKYLGDISVNIDTTYNIEKEMLTRFYDLETAAIIEKCVKRGDVCFDIGANVGAISFALAKRVGAHGKVYACEPGGFLFRRLVDNIRLNSLYENIIFPFNVGFSDNKEVRFWNEDKQNRGNAGFLFSDSNQNERIELIPLDQFYKDQGFDRVDFVKIDVEGMEYEVIRGAAQTIKKYKPILWYETGYFEKGFWAEFLRGEKVVLATEQFLRGMGYRFYKLDSGTIVETRYPDLKYNTLAVCERS